MKVLYLLLIAGLLFGCGAKKSKEPVSTPQTASLDTTKESTLPTLEGSWLSRSYANALLDNLSPYRCAKNFDELTEVAATSQKAVLVLRNMEGVEVNYAFNDAEEHFTLQNGWIATLKKGELTIKDGKKKYQLIKVESPGHSQSILNHFVMSRLFAGTYKSDKGKIKIDINGKLEGWDDFVALKVFTSFDELGDFDMIELTKIDGATKFYGWEMKNGVLILYDLIPGVEYLYEKGEEWTRLALIEAVG